ncbi:hypothetical protein MAP00_004257 [Monascus purpureus]|nr:hypothetical protein MAP00_004257 [Monascus purpureus]
MCHDVPLSLLSVYITGGLADYLGPINPAPADLTSGESHAASSWANLASAFDESLKNAGGTSGVLAGLENLTFSAGVFSLHDPAATNLQYHYTSPEIANAPSGTGNVDANSIYRIASVSKLITVFAGLLELSNEDWNRPLIDIVPGLEEAVHQYKGEREAVYNAQWDKITPWALASQMSGVTTLGIVGTDLLAEYLVALALGLPATDPVGEEGFPPVDASKLGPCWSFENAFCDPYDLAQEINDQQPIFLPWATPSYSDAGFMLLGMAIANITGKPLDAVYQESVFDPLGMTSSYSNHPTGEAEVARSVISGDPDAGFALDGGSTTPSGGLLSTINDLTKLGIGILNSTLYPSDFTRKWMKPITHTASLSYSVGTPWEIIRYAHPSTGKVTDIYTKLGDSGNYGGALVLIPDYDAGFCFLNANSDMAFRSTAALVVLDHITDTIVPALEAQATAEAMRNFVGTYVSTDPNLDSSITISFNESTVPRAAPTLSLSSWISNGTDVLASPLYDGDRPQLLLSIPNQFVGAGKVAFRLSLNTQYNIYTAASGSGVGPFSGEYYTNFGWFSTDNMHYAGNAGNLFVFDIDESGRATAVNPVGMKVTLERQG